MSSGDLSGLGHDDNAAGSYASCAQFTQGVSSETPSNFVCISTLNKCSCSSFERLQLLLHVRCRHDAVFLTFSQERDTTLQHKTDMVARLEQKSTEMTSTMRDLEAQ